MLQRCCMVLLLRPPDMHACMRRHPPTPPAGQFGTRLQGGKDAASARYIFTRLAPLTRHLFNEHDDRLLAYLNEEGQNIEPEWCVPGAGRRWGGSAVLLLHSASPTGPHAYCTSPHACAAPPPLPSAPPYAGTCPSCPPC